MSPSPYKIYVMLGFHTSFYHSWRGDAPDETGFGVDIRVVRAILRLLNEANEAGLAARGYWDIDVYWTIEKIIQPFAPDILASIRKRVEVGLDDIVLGSYNNGANHAATRLELQKAIEYARSNPFGSGLEQLFGRVAPIMRPQECMLSSGQNAIYRQAGVEGLILYYAGVPFNTFGAFVPALPPQSRYNVLLLRGYPDDTPIEVWPCISQMDLFENVCLEALLLKLRQYQARGEVKSDLLVHINFDADADLWLPASLPPGLRWFPNLGGLREYIQVVNRYPWASFTTPSKYRPSHPPQAEVVVQQDLADGGFDGNYSWAEKFTSLKNWTLLEQARLYTFRSETLARRLPVEIAQRLNTQLWEGRESVFFKRLVALSTTHFGMSTPVINSERQAAANALLTSARQQAAEALRSAAQYLSQNTPPDPTNTLYQFEITLPSVSEQSKVIEARTVVRLPALLPPGVLGVRLTDAQGREVKASWVNSQRLPSGWTAGELLFWSTFNAGEPQRFNLLADPSVPASPALLTSLRNPWIELELTHGTGLRKLVFMGKVLGDEEFLQPMVTFRRRRRAKTWRAQNFQMAVPAGEQWDGTQRVRMHGDIPMEADSERLTHKLTYTFSIFEDLPYLLVDAEVEYARTAARDVIENAQQRLRRLIDLRWIETAPFQLKPKIHAQTSQRFLRIWKRNALGIISFYDADYGKINPRNRNLDAFNHQVTHGWVAVSNGEIGLLLAECAESMASMAFCPMRLREMKGIQHIWLNPFGSYFGSQLDYAHLGGNGAGARLTAAASSALRPNAPSFNGQRMRFSLLLAPYLGDAPDLQLQKDAQAFFYPPEVIVLQAPEGIQAVTAADLARQIQIEQDKGKADLPLPPPFNLLASPLERAVDLTWETEIEPEDLYHEIRWRSLDSSEWKSSIAQTTYQRIENLDTRKTYLFQARTLHHGKASNWSELTRAKPGKPSTQSMLRLGLRVPVSTILKIITESLIHVTRVQITRPWQKP